MQSLSRMRGSLLHSAFSHIMTGILDAFSEGYSARRTYCMWLLLHDSELINRYSVQHEQKERKIKHLFGDKWHFESFEEGNHSTSQIHCTHSLEDVDVQRNQFVPLAALCPYNVPLIWHSCTLSSLVNWYVISVVNEENSGAKKTHTLRISIVTWKKWSTWYNTADVTIRPERKWKALLLKDKAGTVRGQSRVWFGLESEGWQNHRGLIC